MSTRHPIGVAAVAAGWALDRAFGEPPARWHPVVGFGNVMSAVERRIYAPTRLAGAAHLAVGISVAATAGVVASRLLGRRAALTLATTVAVAGRMLGDESSAVLALLADGDTEAARERVRGLVGRQTAELDEAGIVRAVVESQAENTIDAVVAPLFWGAVAGAPGVLVHRAINTLDAMVGHHSERYERFGWASARADDLVNYVPARIGTLAVAVLVPRRASAVWRAVRDDAPAHPSPNGGVIEAAVAAALEIRLGGTNTYGDRVEARGVLGDGQPPSVADGRRAVRLTTRVGALVTVVSTATLAFRDARRSR